jgi:hypothetical protein
VSNYKPMVSLPRQFEENSWRRLEERNSTFWALYGGAIGRMGAGKLTFDR